MVNMDVMKFGFFLLFFAGLGLAPTPLSSVIMGVFGITAAKLLFIYQMSVVAGIGSLVLGAIDSNPKPIGR